MKATQSAALLALAFLCTAAAQAVTIATVPVGNPGNAADMRYIDSDHPNGVGSVAYSFHIGRTEVTNAQYVAFLNAVATIADTYGLYSELMGSQTEGGIVRSGAPRNWSYSVKPPALSGGYRYDDKPVTWVSSGDAMRFANWLHNGQSTGMQNASTTEDGAYTLNNAITDFQLAAVTRNAGARWWLPNEDEWYKAAYHKNDGVTANYWNYPTGTDSFLILDNNPPSGDTGDSANFFDGSYTTGNSDFPMTDVGAYSLSGSSYGTFDQGGNVNEWNETLFAGFFRGIRGGSSANSYPTLGAAYWSREEPSRENITFYGFRVASIPEPSTTCLGVLAVIGIWCWNRRATAR